MFSFFKKKPMKLAKDAGYDFGVLKLSEGESLLEMQKLITAARKEGHYNDFDKGIEIAIDEQIIKECTNV